MAPLGPDDGGIELRLQHAAVGGQEELDALGKPLDLGLERAQTVGQLLRQHRNHTAWKVHAGGAVVRINVNGRSVFHIVAHIRNCHQQTPAFDRRLATALGSRLTVHRVVKVARVFAVNRHQGNIGQVHTVGVVLRPHRVGQGLGQRHASHRELVGDAVFAHRDFNLHTGVVHLAEHFLHPTHRLSKQGWRLGQLHHDHLARLGIAGAATGNQNVLAIALVFGRHQPDTAFL